jgi:hypothetical protein
MPTAVMILRAIFPHTYMDDSDMGEFFLNFILHEMLRELAGVDVTQFRTAEELEDWKSILFERIWVRWECYGMGLKASPYQTG